jgi:CheY-like chemotaxis protein
VGKGTGLGLATVYGIVRQNNGFIHVYSEPGQGTTFRIYLPRYQDNDELPAVSPPEGHIPKGGETILLVEDEPMILEMTTEMLELIGYRILAANRPGKAIQMAGEYPGTIHLLLTDVVMPEMNGWDLASKLLTRRPDLKCLFMSGYTADVITQQGFLNKDMSFIQKPFSMSDLTGKIREVLLQ